MALNTFKCNHLMPLHFEGLKQEPRVTKIDFKKWLQLLLHPTCSSARA